MREAIADSGADGICNLWAGCGCGLDDLMPCYQIGPDCVLAKLAPERAEEEGGLQCFVPMTATEDPEEVMP